MNLFHLNKYSLKHLILISIILLIVFGYLLNIAENFKWLHYILPDSYSYIEAGNNFYSSFQVHPIRPMLYPILTGWLSSFGVSHHFIIGYSILLNTFFWFSSLALLYKILKMFSTPKQSFWGGIIFASCFGLIAMVFQPLTEVPFVFFSLFSVYFLFRYRFFGNKINLSYSVAILFLSVLIRPGALYIAILYFGFILSFYLKKEILKTKSLMVVSLSILLLFLQAFLMKLDHGVMRISYIDKVTWYSYLGAQIDAEVQGKTIEETQVIRNAKFTQLESWTSRVDTASSDMSFALKNQPLLFIKHFSFNIFSNMTGKSNAIEALKIREPSAVFKHVKNFFLILSRLENFIFIFGSLFLLFLTFFKRKKIDYIYILLLLYLFYNIFISGITFWQGDRFSIILYPMLIILFFYSKPLFATKSNS